jgi:hypothetical protein
MNASAAIAETEVRIHWVFSLRATIMQMALDLASAVATHLDAVGTASRQAGSPLGRSTYCFKYASHPRGLSPEACFPRSYKGAAQPPCRIPTKGAHPLRNSQARQAPPHGSARLSRVATARFRDEPS